MTDSPSNTSKWDALWTDVNLATMQGAGLGTVSDAAIAVSDGRIAWCGPMSELPDRPERCANTVHRRLGHWILPGFIDCHTHLVYAGNRAAEFEQRLEGVSYEDISRAGGGIQSTVAAVRAASEAKLMDASRPRLLALASEGVTTVEIKSGYGLRVDEELKMLRAARALEHEGIQIVTTLLAAHAVPGDFIGGADAFVEYAIREMLPACREEGLADTVDAFCEHIAFSPAQTVRLFEEARAQGFAIRLHADQLSDLGGAALAARFAARSADHLEYTSPESADAMAEAGTVAVLLPAAFYTLRETQRPPVEAFRKKGVAMAVATDCNPGTAPTASILLAANMACNLFMMTPTEALRGITVHAAKALGLEDRGVLRAGMRADFAVWDLERPAELCYWLGTRRPHEVITGGSTR